MNTVFTAPVACDQVIGSEAQSVIKKMRQGVTVINPEQANAILQNNVKNRMLNRKTVREYVAMMKWGKWTLSMQPILIDRNGFLIDGQHRLRAVVESDTTQPFYIIYNVDPDSFKYLDTGRKRSAADTLHVAGYKLPKEGASIASFLLKFMDGKVGNAVNMGSNQQSYIINADVERFMQKNHSAILRASEVAVSIWEKRTYLTKAFVGSNYYMLSLFANGDQAIQNKVDEFFDIYRSGAGITETHPIYLLHERLRRDQEKGNRGAKLTPGYKADLFTVTWNLFIQDRLSIDELKYRGQERAKLQNQHGKNVEDVIREGLKKSFK